ncbi:MAG: hypothetical protein GY853_04950 [PVC group bacterium]|nr:hypothetical protein [PVC group bacterium]
MKKLMKTAVSVIIFFILFYIMAVKCEFSGYIQGYNNSNIDRSASQLLLLDAWINDAPELLENKTIQEAIIWTIEDYEKAKLDYLKSNNILIKEFQGMEKYPINRVEKIMEQLRGKIKKIELINYNREG